MGADVTTLISALVGAVFGSIGAVSVSHFLQQNAKTKKEKRLILHSKLYPLQDSLESLCYRFDNFANRGGQSVVDNNYFDLTMLYSLGRVLASEQLLTMSDVVPLLDLYFNKLGAYLRSNRIDNLFQGIGFHRYDRATLAEMVMTESGGRFRLSTFIEFRARYESESSNAKDWLKPAVSAINSMSPMKLNELLGEMTTIINDLSKETGVPTTINLRSE
ncbi:hypothetical protein [Kushneria phyllosphaerae]|uniref:Uncharacterized protein n=1 Tax=Kushneria phyllosphaerae TaxID=2100822 RepID=A0A2R8CPX8_9GAMM|nr:hypothetical protein [Kushneria phyllosphaerae]SPJ34961.1 hypothetical protein KSP9073_03010 [Kushneria phyllosphaerae]